MKTKIKRAILSTLLCAALLSGYGGNATAAEAAGSDSAAATIPVESLFSERDLRQDYDADGAIPIQLTGDTATCASDAVKIDGGRITLTDAGVYVVSGTLADGQIVVDAGESDKVQIVLDGADITSASSAAIYSLEADKLFVTLASGSENALANGGTFAAVDDNNVDAAIFSKTDLTLNGTGSLTVTSPAGHGIASKDDLTITGGAYTVVADRHGLVGKDSVTVSDGSFAITSGKDGIHAENADDAEKGFLYIADGSFAIDAQGDALSAGSALQIDGGSYVLTTGGGSSGVTMNTAGAMPRTGGMRDFSANQAPSDSADASAASCKGIVSDGALTVNGGAFTLDTADDAVHSGGDVTITGGEWSIRSGDDGIHSDAAVVIQSGSFSIPSCYEGVEGQSVTIDGGTLDITAYDDGINAAGGADGSGTGFGFGQRDSFSADDACSVVINGGTITIVSDGDSIDSNGSLTVNGGTLNLTCNGNGNTAIDASGTFANNGGTITTNDGSESGTGGRGGMGGGRGGMNGGRGGMGGEKPSGDGKQGDA